LLMLGSGGALTAAPHQTTIKDGGQHFRKQCVWLKGTVT
jgi:hypothetical protein